MPVWYFAYGSNLDQEGMRKRIKNWYDLKPAVLRGFKLVFDYYSSSWGGGVADVVESEGGMVYGGAYLLDESQLKILDKYEGVPHIYSRRKVNVEIEGKPVEAFIYVVRNPRKYITPSTEYVSRMIRGLKKLGYGEDVIERVRKAAAGG